MELTKRIPIKALGENVALSVRMVSLKVAFVMLICISVVAAPMPGAAIGDIDDIDEPWKDTREFSPVPGCNAQESSDRGLRDYEL